MWLNGGIGKTRPPGAPPLDPTCPKFSFDALARRPQPLPSTHTFSPFFSSTWLGLTGPRRTRGLRDSPFSPHVGGVCPRKSAKFVYHPRVVIMSLHLTDIIPLHDTYSSPRGSNHIYTSRYSSPNIPRAEQPRQLRVVAIDIFGKQCTKNQ